MGWEFWIAFLGSNRMPFKPLLWWSLTIYLQSLFFMLFWWDVIGGVSQNLDRDMWHSTQRKKKCSMQKLWPVPAPNVTWRRLAVQLRSLFLGIAKRRQVERRWVFVIAFAVLRVLHINVLKVGWLYHMLIYTTRLIWIKYSSKTLLNVIQSIFGGTIYNPVALDLCLYFP